MIAKPLQLNENLEELIPRPDETFPVWAFYESFDLHEGGRVPWHWHPDVEITWILQGSIRLCTNNQTITLHAGDGAFINANALHYKELLPGTVPTALDLLFDPLLISGSHRSVYEQKYITPILTCRDLEVMPLTPSVTNQRTLLEHVRNAYDAADRGLPGYEFTVRNHLSDAWFLLFQESETLLHSKPVIADHREERIKKMLLYIQQHFQEKLSLEQIADAANISSRECLRCFNQSLNTTPFTYLLEYRIRQAADELKHTGHAVTDIAYACGFSNTSYFGKTFRKFMNCSPSEYRSLYQNRSETVSEAK